MRVNPAAPFTNAGKARRFAMVAAAGFAIAAVCLVIGGYGAKDVHTQSLAAKHAVSAHIYHRTTRLDDVAPAEEAPAEEASDASMVPDPGETTRKAKEAMAKARSLSIIINAIRLRLVVISPWQGLLQE